VFSAVDTRTQLPIVGMVGGGQLARMTQQAAIALGQSLAVLAESPDDSAALVCRDVSVGAPNDLAALRAFAAHCDVLTFDHEHVPGEMLRTLQSEGVAVYPSPDALIYAQDKAHMRRRLAELGIPVPAFEVCAAGEMPGRITTFAEKNGWPVVVKVARGGYDGHGVWMVDGPSEIPAVPAAPTFPPIPPEAIVVLEQRVPLVRELAAVVARSPFGQAAAWPVVETVQRDGMCVEVVAPAQGLDPARAAAATELALRIADALGVVGVLAVELFEVPPSAAAPDGLLVNELAMRPHNSGHWTIDGSVTSQFEQHLRAVLDYPLGSTVPVAPVTVMANVLGGAAGDGVGEVGGGGDGAAAGAGAGDEAPDGGSIGMDERVHHLAARFPDVKVHLYGKAFRPGRKLGHVTVTGDDAGALRRRAALAAEWLGSGVWADGYQIHPVGDRQVLRRADGLTGRHGVSTVRHEGQGRI
jgi:5-(carboxyamino)imidazole ribonucleotide synthase